jgi:mannose-6-phosphate isomerase-like protein (cupin superfamily)
VAPHDLALPPDQLAGIAQGIARSPLWHGLAAASPEGRSAVRALTTRRYEVWVLGWWPGQGVDLHEHGDSHAAFTVVEGELVEIAALRTGELRRRPLRMGDTRLVPAGARHDVLNVAPTSATSVHVYSPPLRAMTFYDPVDQRPVRVEPVEHHDAVWPDRAAHRWLHPARARRA